MCAADRLTTILYKVKCQIVYWRSGVPNLPEQPPNALSLPNTIGLNLLLRQIFPLVISNSDYAAAPWSDAAIELLHSSKNILIRKKMWYGIVA